MIRFLLIIIRFRSPRFRFGFGTGSGREGNEGNRDWFAASLHALKPTEDVAHPIHGNALQGGGWIVHVEHVPQKIQRLICDDEVLIDGDEPAEPRIMWLTSYWSSGASTG